MAFYYNHEFRKRFTSTLPMPSQLMEHGWQITNTTTQVVVGQHHELIQENIPRNVHQR